MGIKNFFNNEQKEHILQAIREAEKETSGEIRLHLDSRCKIDPLEKAVKLFGKLKMNKTVQRNGTLIYLAVKDRKFAIYGDSGINRIVPDNYWQDVRDIMQEHFEKSEFTEGIVKAVSLIGEKLKEFFPYQDDDVNELPDEISIGE